VQQITEQLEFAAKFTSLQRFGIIDDEQQIIGAPSKEGSSLLLYQISR
jgi:hypothetical protein